MKNALNKIVRLFYKPLPSEPIELNKAIRLAKNVVRLNRLQAHGLKLINSGQISKEWFYKFETSGIRRRRQLYYRNCVKYSYVLFKAK